MLLRKKVRKYEDIVSGLTGMITDLETRETECGDQISENKVEIAELESKNNDLDNELTKCATTKNKLKELVAT